MNYQKLLSLVVFIAVLFTACKKDVDNTNPDQPKNMNELVIPNDFNWSTTKNVKIIVNIQSTKSYQPKSKISVFYGDPVSDGKLIASGSASAGNSFSTTIGIPAYVEEIFLMYESPFGSKEVVNIPLTSSTITYTFSEYKESPVNGIYKATGEIGPECGAECDQVISGSGSYTIGNGEIYCVTDNFTGSITFQTWNGGGTLQVCGTATINNITLGNGCHIIVSQNGSLSINNFSSWGNPDIKVYENATLIINGQFMTQGAFVENQGTMEVSGDLIIQNLTGEFNNSGTITVTGFVNVSGVSLNNSGTMNVTGSYFHFNSGSTVLNSGTIHFTSTSNLFEVNSGSSLTNDGEVNVIGSLSINAGSNVINNCKMICTETLEINTSNFVTNSGYLKGENYVHLTSNSITTLNEGSLLTTNELTLDSNGEIIGTGTLNSIKALVSFTINSNNIVDGSIEAATDNLILTQGGQIEDHFINGATVVGLDEITNYIPIHECNPEGIGEPSVIDSDLDGVPDDLDDYPFDPERAYNNYFPSEDAYVSVAFEDLWPSTGDYDFNDLVLAVYGTIVTNAGNQIVDILINFVVRADGASLDNGFGFQIESMTWDQVTSATGMVLEQGYVTLNANGTEAGQTKAVIIVAESVEDVIHRVGGAMFNTVENGYTGTSDTTLITMYFNPPLDPTSFEPDDFNPFLIKNQNRSVEIHLADMPPTDKMNFDLFGTYQDDSRPLEGRYYKTANNLPWGIMILDDVFDYPIEKIPIIEAYNHFAAWAESGGTVYQDWYRDLPGYRDNSKIYGAD